MDGTRLQLDSKPRVTPLGDRLAFVIGAFRSGTTLLRKILDAHPEVRAPAESWFLLPLLNLWDGKGEHPEFRPSQASAALRGL
ncbi:MAG: sulfotransferase, partial [Phycisphaerales bacterium]|nr:sulfotransferase [Phycisphaerales bacterium]